MEIEWLSNEEAAEVLGIKPRTLDNWCTNGKIPYYRPGAKRRFKREDLDAFIESTRHEAQGGGNG